MRSAGFTLIELLVVISIIGILSVMGYANYKDFASNQIAKKAVGQVQTYLRLAQSNATTSTLCNGDGAISWSLNFTSINGIPKKIELHCTKQSEPIDNLINTLVLENAQLSVRAIDCTSDASLPLTFKYKIGDGALTITPSDNCMQNSSYLTFKITNTKNSAFQDFKITKGGAIDVK